jgi:microcystin-dependent protein
MTTITGFTSERMLGIENNTVVSGVISGDDLILTKHDGTTVIAGEVRGPVGPQGPEGEVTTENLNSAIDGVNTAVSANTSAIAQNTLDIANVEDIAYEVADRLPAGVVSMTIMQSIPTGWLELNGLTIPDANAEYPELYAAAPSAWKTGGSLNLPDMRGRMPVGQHASNALFNQLEEKGGVTSVTLQKANVPKHAHEMPTHNHTMPSHSHTLSKHKHSINHNHPARTTTATTHNHTTSETAINSGLAVVYQGGGGSLGIADGNVWGGVWGNPLNVGKLNGSSSGGSHTHSVDLPNFTGTSGEASGTNTSSVDPGDTNSKDPGDTKDGTLDGLGSSAFTTVSPYFVLRFIIKAH